MRLLLNIEHLPEQKLPINYQYLISSWIYKTIHRSDSEFAEWLHEEGYTYNGKKYKHFCYSTLQPRRYKIHSNNSTFELAEGPTKLMVSFNIDKAAKDLLKAVFQDNVIELNSGKNFKFLGMINHVQLSKPPDFTNHPRFKSMTPICISVGSDTHEHAQYLQPGDHKYAAAFCKNLVDKANAFLEEDKFNIDQVSFKLLTPDPKSKLWTIKGISIKGYEFEFELDAPVELMEIGYYAGFGVQNSSLGMGLVETV